MDMETLLVKYINGPWAGTEILKEEANEIGLSWGKCHFWHYTEYRRSGNVVEMWGKLRHCTGLKIAA